MARKGPKTIATSDGGASSNRSSNVGAALVNFQYARPPSSVQAPSQHQRPNQSNHRTNSSNRRNDNHRNTRQPLAARSARKRNSNSQFYLHSSPNHAFVLTRLPGRLEQEAYTFDNVDAPVSWQAVRLVKYFSTSLQKEACPICLDEFTCARITKCGHVFCLACLMHHIHSVAQTNMNNAAPKCPCCAVPTCLSDVRPVLLQSVTSPAVNQAMKFVKLARTKHCSSPYILLPDAPKRSSPRAAPCVNDVDAAYCRFNYVHPDLFQEHLQANLIELQQHGQTSRSVFDTMSLQFVQEELRKAVSEAAAEWSKMEQFANLATGMYQVQKPQQQHMTLGKDIEQLTHHNIECETADASCDTLRDASITDERSCRSRGDSIVSYDSQATGTDACSRSVGSRRSQHFIGGSMYLDNPEDHIFYQAEDGTLCFLCGFNMKCLQMEYAACPLDGDSRFPLPDAIGGRIVELDRVLLTQEKRQRFRFLSHLPVDSEIVFVELSLGHVLSRETKQHFQKEFAKRKHARSSRLNAEKAADNRQKRIEQARIDDLKARFQQIDPNDDFFRSPEPEPLHVMTGDEFGPSVSLPSRTTAPIAATLNANPALSFSHMIRTTHGLREYDFPSLGSDNPSSEARLLPPNHPAPSWGKPLVKVATDTASTHNSAGSTPIEGGKKRNKGKKVLLFSIGGGVH
ncbi:hypothetical protein MPSEU_001096500 [Mayamaea pseudoterrestris]|nr:hypothetical protein MPSEU_001096500 [Mayamaea pseudoterrestris]